MSRLACALVPIVLCGCNAIIGDFTIGEVDAGTPGTCANPFDLAVGAVRASTEGFDPADGACPARGSAVVYRFTPTLDGALEVVSDISTSISVRTSCDAPGTETACDPYYVSVPVKKGQDVFVFAQTNHVDRGKEFQLQVRHHPIVCGDGFLDPGEDCEDDGTGSGTCSANCRFQVSDPGEPNNGLGTALDYTPGMRGTVRADDRTDFVRYVLPPGNTALTVETSFFLPSCVNLYAVAYLLGPHGGLMKYDLTVASCDVKFTKTGLTPGESYFVEIANLSPFLPAAYELTLTPAP